MSDCPHPEIHSVNGGPMRYCVCGWSEAPGPPDPRLTTWAAGHPFLPRADEGFGCERCGRGPTAPVHRRYLSLGVPQEQAPTDERWEAEARILGREGAEAADLLAGALGYSDRYHTDTPLGTSIPLFLARQAAARVAAAPTEDSQR